MNNETSLVLTKIRPDDVLGNLPEEDQERVLEWLENASYRDVLQQIEEPRPGGLGLKVHFNSLRNFYLKNLPLRLAIRRHDDALDWKALESDVEHDPIHLHELIRESLEKQVLVSLQSGDPTSNKAMELVNCLLRFRKQEAATRSHGIPLSTSEQKHRQKLLLPNSPAPKALPQAVPAPQLPPVPTEISPDGNIQAALNNFEQL